MRTAYVIAAKRTPVVPARGAFAQLPYYDLAAPVIADVLAAAGVDVGEVDEVIVGNALGAGGNPARLVALASGLPRSVAGLSVDRQCVSGLDAILLANALVTSGQADVVLAGGAESYSQRPLRAYRGADGPEFYEQARFTPWPDRDPDMHEAADVLAERCGITRAEQDAWAVRSHRFALEARAVLKAEMTPLLGIEDDAFTRGLNAKLAARAPTLSSSITSANTAVAADGAAFCLVMSPERFARYQTEMISAGAKVKALEIMAGKTLGGDPSCPGLAPIQAILHSLGMAGMSACDVTHVELMEAYAVQAIACIQGAKLPEAVVNVRGGALARGHPVGASGAVLMVRLYHDLCGKSRSDGAGIGLAAIAAAGGIGTAVLVRKVEV